MKTLIYVLLFAVCVFCSCEKESHPILPEYTPEIKQEEPTSSKEGFIQGYLDADRLCGWQEHDTVGGCIPLMGLWLEGEEYYDNPRWVTESSRLYQQYAEQLGDTAFPQTIYRDRPNSEIVAVNKIAGIDVICNDDFDENHKAGSSVSDILTFIGNSPVNYIKSGYKIHGEKETTPQTFSRAYAYEKIVVNAAEISEKNIQFYDYSFDLSFNKLPEKSGTYTFNVVMKFTDKELKNTITMVF